MVVINGCVIYFSRNYIDSNISDQIPKDIKGDEFFIGFEGKTPILINEDTGLDRSGRTIADIIVYKPVVIALPYLAHIVLNQVFTCTTTVCASSTISSAYTAEKANKKAIAKMQSIAKIIKFLVFMCVFFLFYSPF